MKRIIFKNILLAGLFLPVFGRLAAQNAPAPTDAVHLVSGKMYSGIVIEQKPGESIRLWHLPEGDTLLLPMDEIERIVKILPQANTVSTSGPVAAKSSGAGMSMTESKADYNTKRYYVMVHGMTGGGNYSFAGFGVSLSYLLSNHKTSLGLGAHYIGDNSTGNFTLETVQMFPIMAEFRHEFKTSANGRFGTALYCNAGYVVNITGNANDQNGEIEYKNGWALNPGIGLRMNILRNLGLMLDLGWMHHVNRLNWLPPAVQSEQKSWNNFILRGTLFF